MSRPRASNHGATPLKFEEPVKPVSGTFDGTIENSSARLVP
jgi:hypothetical protein